MFSLPNSSLTPSGIVTNKNIPPFLMPLRGWRLKRVSEDEMAGWHHQCNGYELGKTSGYGEGQADLVCCSPRGRKVRHDWATTVWEPTVKSSLWIWKNSSQTANTLLRGMWNETGKELFLTICISIFICSFIRYMYQFCNLEHNACTSRGFYPFLVNSP